MNMESIANVSHCYGPDWIVRAARPYSMVSDEGLLFTIETVRNILNAGLPGVFVECGVWRGGASIAMLLAQQKHLLGHVSRPVHMLDSFQGLPPVEECDGPAAADWQSKAKSPTYFANCYASRFEVVCALQSFGFGDRDAIIWEGWFTETIPSVLGMGNTDSIALLRLDCD
jgi:hypothetical protein